MIRHLHKNPNSWNDMGFYASTPIWNPLTKEPWRQLFPIETFLKLTFLQPPLYVFCCIHLSWLPQCYLVSLFLWSEAPNSKGTADHTLHSCCHSLKLFCLISVIFKIEHYLPRIAACWTVKTNSFFPSSIISTASFSINNLLLKTSDWYVLQYEQVSITPVWGGKLWH